MGNDCLIERVWVWDDEKVLEIDSNGYTTLLIYLLSPNFSLEND